MTELARLIGVTPRCLRSYESGEFAPSDENLALIGKHLRFPVEFFAGSTIDPPSADSVSFRSMASMSAAKRNAALGASAIGVMLSDWVGARFDLPEASLPLLRGHDPEAAAHAVRSAWGLGERPIKNMVHLLESRGVRVFSLVEENREVDAFSFWREATPYVFLNTQKTAEHSRFDAAHELGHLALHRHGGPRGKGAEHEADRFASAFLMPAGSVISERPRLPSIETLIRLKATWNVSLSALNYRLNSLNLISSWQYRSNCIEISRRGYRTSEPHAAPRETSQVLQKVFQALRADGIGRADVARELCIDVPELESLVFGLVMRRLDGDALVQTPRSAKANLRRL